MKIIKMFMTVFFSLGILWAGDKENPKAVLSLEQNISISAGESKVIDVKVNVPNGYGLVIGHSGKSLNMIADFAHTPGSGIQFDIENRPSGAKKGNNLLAKGNVSFGVRLSELKGAKSGTVLNSDLVFNYQLCALSDGKCLSPDGISKSVSVKISKDKEHRFAGVRSRSADAIKWAGTYENALKAAKSSGQNIYVIVTAPTWCGACKMMERETFEKSDVQKVLNSDFVSLQVLDTSSDLEKFNIRGFPTSFVLDSSGKELTQMVGGVRAPTFLNFVASFRKAKKSDNSDIPVPPDAPDSPNTDIPTPPTLDDNVVITSGKTVSWEVQKNVAQYGGADWSGFLGTMFGTEEQCRKACSEVDDCHAFFIVLRGYLDLAPTGPNKFWRHFRPGECVFLKGKPWVGEAGQSDMHYKKIDGKNAFETGK